VRILSGLLVLIDHVRVDDMSISVNYAISVNHMHVGACPTRMPQQAKRVALLHVPVKHAHLVSLSFSSLIAPIGMLFEMLSRWPQYFSQAPPSRCDQSYTYPSP
jgi:hypothetical protein